MIPSGAWAWEHVTTYGPFKTSRQLLISARSEERIEKSGKLMRYSSGPEVCPAQPTAIDQINHDEKEDIFPRPVN